MGLLCGFGKSKQVFKIDRVSNHRFTTRELAQWKRQMKDDCEPMLTPEECTDRLHTTTLLVLGAPITIEGLKQQGYYSDMDLRLDLKIWAREALARHRTFLSTLLYGCTVHPQETTFEQTTFEIPIPPQTPHGLNHHTAIGESSPMRLTDDATGARVTITTVTTLSPTAITTVTTSTKTSNPILPMIGGLPHVLESIASFLGVPIGEELRRTRETIPAIKAYLEWHRLQGFGFTVPVVQDYLSGPYSPMGFYGGVSPAYTPMYTPSYTTPMAVPW